MYKSKILTYIRILDDTTSINLASGNLEPKSGEKVNNYPLLKQVIFILLIKFPSRKIQEWKKMQMFL